jgi:hypothetical protein
MSFLSPWFLLGFALVAGPIVAHLIRRVTRERQQFSAMRFLTESPPRLSKRSRIQHPLLLLLRCLIVAVLAAGFARPFLREDIPLTPSANVPQSVIAILDDSASMRRAGLWPAARQKISDLAASLKDGDQFALFTASGAELVARERWQQTPAGERTALVRSALAAREPGWGPTPLDNAIETAARQWEQMADATESTAKKKLVVVSDLAAGTRVAGLAGFTWPKNCEVTLERLTPDHAGNAGLQWLGWAPDPSVASLPDGSVPAAVARVRVVQSAADPAAPLKLQLTDPRTGRAIGPAQTIIVAPGDAQVALVPVPAGVAGSGPTTAKPGDSGLRLDLTGDAEPFDNTLWLVRPAPREISLAYYGADSADDLKHARFYLERATAGWKDPVVKVRAVSDGLAAASGDPKASAPGDLKSEISDSKSATTAAAPSASASAPAASAAGSATVAPGKNSLPELAVVAAPLTAEAARALRERLAAGAFAVVLLNDPAMVDTAEALAGETGWAAATAARADALLGSVDLQHPLFAPFADSRYSNFASIRFWKPQPVALPPGSKAVVVARFDDGQPAVIETVVGKGRLIVWGGDWSTAAGQWVISTKFVPWLQALFERAVGGAVRPSLAEVGDTARLVGVGAAQWRAVLDSSSTFAGAAPSQPGIYELAESGVTRLVAVQVPAAESNVAPLPLDDFEKLGVPLHPVTLSATDLAKAPKPAAGMLTATYLEGRQRFWRWLLVGAAALLALESLFSYVIARREAVIPAAATSP